MSDDRIDRLIAAIEELVALMREDAEPEVPVVLRPAPPKGARLRA